MSRAFVTGSRWYGTPREDSDIDLVVVVSPEEAEILWSLSENPGGSVRFGRLNLIVLTDEDQGDTWDEHRGRMRAHAPVEREFAVAALQAMGIGGQPSGRAKA